MGTFERFLSVWVALAIAVGVALGLAAPGAFEVIATLEWARVNLVVAVLIWLMIYPMMLKVDPSCLKDVGRKPKGIALTLVVNWLIKPFTMAALSVLFFKYVFAAWVPAEDAEQYIAGMILLGVAPCTAMVFVWSHLTNGDANYTLVQVSLNDLILVFAFAPVAGMLLGVTDLEVPWETLLASVVIFVVAPLAAGLLTHRHLGARGGLEAIEKLASKLKPTSILGLLLTVVLLFGFQAETIVEQPGRVALIAVPLLPAELRNLRDRLWPRASASTPLRRCGTGGDDRHIELLRARGRRRHQPLRSLIGRCSRHRCWRPHRGAGHAVAGVLCQPDEALVPCARPCSPVSPSCLATTSNRCFFSASPTPRDLR
jgi:ACR3 family arsenite transporter